MQLTVLAVNDAPSAIADDYAVAEDGELAEDAPGVLDNDTDVDGDPLTAELVSGPADGTLTLQPDGSFVYRPDPDFTGTDTFTYRACDDAGPPACSPPRTVTITVTTDNDAPRTAAGRPRDARGRGALGRRSGRARQRQRSRGRRADRRAGERPGPRHPRPARRRLLHLRSRRRTSSGEDSFTYRACDDAEPRACSAPETVTIDVAEVNDDPVADDDAGVSETSQATTVAVLEGDTDPDGDELHVSDFGQPAHGTVDCTPAGVCTYTPEPGFVGTDSFEYDGERRARRQRPGHRDPDRAGRSPAVQPGSPGRGRHRRDPGRPAGRHRRPGQRPGRGRRSAESSTP